MQGPGLHPVPDLRKLLFGDPSLGLSEKWESQNYHLMRLSYENRTSRYQCIKHALANSPHSSQLVEDMCGAVDDGWQYYQECCLIGVIAICAIIGEALPEWWLDAFTD